MYTYICIYIYIYIYIYIHIYTGIRVWGTKVDGERREDGHRGRQHHQHEPVQGSGFRVQGSGFGVWGSGFRV